MSIFVRWRIKRPIGAHCSFAMVGESLDIASQRAIGQLFGNFLEALTFRESLMNHMIDIHNGNFYEELYITEGTKV